ncbi:MAG: hypothetical protein ABI614_20710 [Planctomycetota bacterium]
MAAIERLQRGEIDVLVLSGEAIVESTDSIQVVLPGAFNPLHEGHRWMAQVAANSLSVPVAFELSIENVDKPPLDIDTLEGRLSQFGEQQTICVTRAATFEQKVLLFRDASFAVGADTIMRIADVRYYGNDLPRRDQAIATIVATGARFLVFGRTMSGGFRTLGQLHLPEPLRAICREVSEDAFRHDISSSEIRLTNSPNE